MLVALAVFAAFANVQADLDGDGKPEALSYDAKAAKVRLGTHTVDCEGEPCTVTAADVSSEDKAQDAIVCHSGPRDDAWCFLHTIRDGKLVRYNWPDKVVAPTISTSGNGIVLVVDTFHYRMLERVDKYTVKGLELVRVRQPVHLAAVRKTVHVDRTFPLLFDPTSKDVVGNVRADSDIEVAGVHGTHDGWLLVRLSSGISGYVKFETLMEASDAIQQTMMAG